MLFVGSGWRGCCLLISSERMLRIEKAGEGVKQLSGQWFTSEEGGRIDRSTA